MPIGLFSNRCKLPEHETPAWRCRFCKFDKSTLQLLRQETDAAEARANGELDRLPLKHALELASDEAAYNMALAEQRASQSYWKRCNPDSEATQLKKEQAYERASDSWCSNRVDEMSQEEIENEWETSKVTMRGIIEGLKRTGYPENQALQAEYDKMMDYRSVLYEKRIPWMERARQRKEEELRSQVEHEIAAVAERRRSRSRVRNLPPRLPFGINTSREAPQSRTEGRGFAHDRNAIPPVPQIPAQYRQRNENLKDSPKEDWSFGDSRPHHKPVTDPHNRSQGASGWSKSRYIQNRLKSQEHGTKAKKMIGRSPQSSSSEHRHRIEDDEYGSRARKLTQEGRKDIVGDDTPPGLLATHVFIRQGRRFSDLTWPEKHLVLYGRLPRKDEEIPAWWT